MDTYVGNIIYVIDCYSTIIISWQERSFIVKGARYTDKNVRAYICKIKYSTVNEAFCYV